MSNEKTRSRPLTVAAQVLAHLQLHKRASSEDMAKALKVDPGTLGETVKKMFKAGVLEKIQHVEQIKSFYNNGQNRDTVRNRWAIAEPIGKTRSELIPAR